MFTRAMAWAASLAIVRSVRKRRPGLERLTYGCSDSLHPADPDHPTYTWTSIAATGTRVLLSDDQVSTAIPIGFNFDFYATIYTQAYISSNGFIGFLPTMSNGCCSGRPLPGLDGMDGIIAGIWDDLYPPNGFVYYQTLGSAPFRRFVVEYNGVPRCCGTIERATFQIVLLEGSSSIYMHYVTDGNSTRTSTIGVENTTATSAVQVYYGTTSALAYDNVTVRCEQNLDLDSDSDGFSIRAGDCNDSAPLIYPGAPEICDGADTDCNPVTPDGAAEAWYGNPCDGADVDLCEEGGLACTAGAPACSDATGNTPDLCSGTDDDCNPATADGSGEAWNGAPCDGPDLDTCPEGVYSCVAAAQFCSDDTGDFGDLCDGIDNDCDPATPDGSAEAWFGEPCDGRNSDLCPEGVFNCTDGVQICTDTNFGNLDTCDAADNDCDPTTPDGEDETWYGTPCDGPDADPCTEGINDCVGAARICTDVSDDTLDLCDGTDDDCDPSTADGAGETWLGAACDGDDLDLCEDGVYECTGGVQTCTDAPDGTVDTCDGGDNDCDPSTPDGYAEAWFGVACDGPDDDLCEDDSYGCEGAVQVCVDFTGVAADICDGADNDCDPATDDGSGEIWLGEPCDGDDLDLCEDGVYECTAGAQLCTDDTAESVETCNGVDDDCDGVTDEDDVCGGSDATGDVETTGDVTTDRRRRRRWDRGRLGRRLLVPRDRDRRRRRPPARVRTAPGRPALRPPARHARLDSSGRPLAGPGSGGTAKADITFTCD